LFDFPVAIFDQATLYVLLREVIVVVMGGGLFGSAVYGSALDGLGIVLCNVIGVYNIT